MQAIVFAISLNVGQVIHEHPRNIDSRGFGLLGVEYSDWEASTLPLSYARSMCVILPFLSLDIPGYGWVWLNPTNGQRDLPEALGER